MVRVSNTELQVAVATRNIRYGDTTSNRIVRRLMMMMMIMTMMMMWMWMMWMVVIAVVII